MTRLPWLCALAWLVGSPRRARGGAARGDGPLVRAMTDELARSEQLRLPDAAKPHFSALRLNDRTDFSVVASFGALVRKYEVHGRYLRAGGSRG